MRDRIALLLAAATGLLHLAVSGRYDVFRDELYFIVCGRHPAFGYADQPPLVPLLAAGAYAFGAHAWLLRLPAVLAAAALVWLTVRFARLLGGGDGAAWAAGITAAVAPMFLGLTATLNTTTFEPLGWTAVAYALARAVLRDDRRAPVWAGIVAGIAMEAKYALAAWLVSLAVALLLTRERKLLARRELWLGVALAALIALPSVLWQSAHGWPFVDVVHAAKDKNVATPPPAFFLNQIVVLDPLFAPLWIAGMAAPFAWRDLARLRFLALAYIAVAAVMLATPSKDYYLAAAYPTLFALGAVAFERLVRSAAVRAAYLVAATAVAAIGAPLALPLLDVPALVGYQRALHLRVQEQERTTGTTAIPQTYADELGWRDFTREVGTAYASLTPEDRAHTAILVDNYGEAAALDVYGAPYALPPALSGHNQYYLWGLRGQHPAHLLRVQRDLDALRPYCMTMRDFGRASSPYARPFENRKSIAFCRGVHPPLAKIWPQLKDFE